jgi:hypothetical protein
MYLPCPYCKKGGEYDVSEGYFTNSCIFCKKTFVVLIAKVRSKRSRGDKSSSTRNYRVRVLCNSKEKFIEFDSDYYYDFELRAGDNVLFVFHDTNGAYFIRNLTIGHYMILKKEINYVVVIKAAVVIIIIIAIIAIASAH